MAIKGIKSVDFIISAKGEGVVNANGSLSVYNPAANTVVNNHVFPKMRGMDPMQRAASFEGTGSVLPSLADPALKEAALIVSSECIRSGLFKDVSFGLVAVDTSNVSQVLASLHGLVRGYLITAGGRNFARKSPLFVTDFDCAKPGLVFNQGNNAKVRGTDLEKTSMYSYFKTGKDLAYTGKASLSIEDLQFIPLENSLGRSSFDHQVSVAQGEAVAQAITQFLQDLAAPGLVPKASFVKKAVRVGAVQRTNGEAGILLNDDAIRVVAAEVRALIEGLNIRQGKGYLQVDKVTVDFNDSTRVFRAEVDTALANPSDSGAFARYYEEVSISDADFAAQQERSRESQAMRDAEKKRKKADKDARTAAKKAGKTAEFTDAAA